MEEPMHGYSDSRTSKHARRMGGKRALTSKSRLRSDGLAFPACCAADGDDGTDASPTPTSGSSTARSLSRSPMVSSGPPTPRIILFPSSSVRYETRGTWASLRSVSANRLWASMNPDRAQYDWPEEKVWQAPLVQKLRLASDCVYVLTS